MEARTTVPELRPLSLGEILDTAFRVYRANVGTLWLCVVWFVVPLAVGITLLTLSVDPDAFGPSPEAATSENPFGGAEVSATAVVGLVLAVVLVTLATAACTRAVAGAYLGRPVDWRASLGFGLRRVGPLVALSLLTGAAVLAGALALLIGAIYVGVRLFLASPALVVEDESATGAMGRSWALVKDRWWATFAVVLVTFLLLLVVGAVIQSLVALPGQLADSQLLSAVLSTLGQILSDLVTIPLQAAVLTILYFDLRVRKEGFDLALLAEGVEAGEGDAEDAGLGPERPSD